MIFRLLSFFIILHLISCSNCKEYVPQVYTGEGIIEKQELLTKEHILNMVQVLEYYGENYKVSNGKLFICSSADKELILNYTTKANDPQWLEQHKP